MVNQEVTAHFLPDGSAIADALPTGSVERVAFVIQPGVFDDCPPAKLFPCQVFGSSHVGMMGRG